MSFHTYFRCKGTTKEPYLQIFSPLFAKNGIFFALFSLFLCQISHYFSQNCIVLAQKRAKTAKYALFSQNAAFDPAFCEYFLHICCIRTILFKKQGPACRRNSLAFRYSSFKTKTCSLSISSETAATLQRLSPPPGGPVARLMPPPPSRGRGPPPLLLILTAANDDRNQEPPTMERPACHEPARPPTMTPAALLLTSKPERHPPPCCHGAKLRRPCCCHREHDRPAIVNQ